MVTIRVYGVYINEQQQVLVSDELIKGDLYTKFPGGGLEVGEGLKDCLVREFKEEMSRDIVVKEHLYTTDFYVESAFAAGVQVVSIYYTIDFLNQIVLPVQNLSPTMEMFLTDNPKKVEKHRLIDKKHFLDECFQLPIDKLVSKIIQKKYL